MSSKDNKIQKNGLTTQEYSFKHAIPIETLLKNESSAEVKKALQTISNNNPNEEQKNILKAYQDLSLLKVVDSESLIDEAMAIANVMASKSADALKLAKRLLNSADRLSFPDHLDLCSANQAMLHHAPEHETALKAFFTKK